MPKTKKKRKPLQRGLTLYPLTFEDAMKRILSTPLPEGERRKRRKAK